MTRRRRSRRAAIHDWPPPDWEEHCAAMHSCRVAAEADGDFRTMKDAYMGASEDRILLAIMRDRLLDLGATDEAAQGHINEVRMSHPDNEIPF